MSYAEARLLVQHSLARDLDDESTRPAIHFAAPQPGVRVRVVTNERVDGNETINNIVLTIEGAMEPGACTVLKHEIEQKSTYIT